MAPRVDTKKAAAASIVFDGQLLETPSDAPRCGDVKVAVAYKFGVEKLVRGKKGGKILVVLIPCPDLKGPSFFTAGASYRIAATDDLGEARAYTIYNDYARSPLLWAISIEKLRKARR